MNNPWPSQPHVPPIGLVNQAGALGQWADVIQAQSQSVLGDADRNTLLQQWHDMAQKLDAMKESEANLRAACVKAFFGMPAEGINNLELGRGYKLKCVGKINYNLGGSTEVVGALEAIAAINDEGKFIAERLVKWEPKLSISEYRKLPEMFKLILDKVLTTKPGSPQLEIIEPKDAK